MELIRPFDNGWRILRSLEVFPVRPSDFPTNFLANQVNHDLAQTDASAVIDITLTSAATGFADHLAMTSNVLHIDRVTRVARINVAEESLVIHILHSVVGGEIGHLLLHHPLMITTELVHYSTS